MPSSPLEDLFDRFATHIHAGKVDLFRELGIELTIGAREGPRFQDATTGRWYWNCHNNGGVFNLGHRNPQVVAALRSALDELDIGNHHLVSRWRTEAAEKLVASTNASLPGVVFAASGSEAVDAALKLARGYTGRPGVVTIEGGYHGCTGLALAAGEPGPRQRYLLDLPGFTKVPYNDLEAMRATVDETTAAVLLEAIPATLGFPPPDPGYLAAVARSCREQGALLILDEVQTGLGRTGTFWYHQQEGVRPDVLVTGKGLSGGLYPMAAALVAREPFGWFTEDYTAHVSTYGGSELGCVVASTVCDIVAAPGFLEHVKRIAGRFADGFTGAGFEVRQRGLTMGLVVGEEGGALEAWKALFDNGVFAFPAAYDTSVVQFKPPLILTVDQSDEIIDRVRTAIG
ncbi:MAG: aminotransferase class III-fold pyridoxal phosphate-dependent enzyme [Nitriliruptorales bacterium]|nr:aminotransferase class III-fold pyridoxal phosphate-dependent enzyme [Nitriliruptorales bacterium]